MLKSYSQSYQLLVSHKRWVRSIKCMILCSPYRVCTEFPVLSMLPEESSLTAGFRELENQLQVPLSPLEKFIITILFLYYH